MPTSSSGRSHSSSRSSTFGRGMGSYSYSRSKPSYKPTPVPSPSPVYTPSTPSTVTVEASRPTFGQTLKEGFGFGAGSAIAHRIFGASSTQTVNHINTPSNINEKKCNLEENAYFDCTKNHDGYSCETKYENYKKCLGSNIYCESELNAYNSCVKYNGREYCDANLKTYESCIGK